MPPPPPILFTPTQYLFSASLDGRIKVWDLEKELVLQTLHRHSDSVNVLVWTRSKEAGVIIRKPRSLPR